MTASEYPWMPVGATYVQGKWMVLMARWTPAEGWTFQQLVINDAETYNQAAHPGGVQP